MHAEIQLTIEREFYREHFREQTLIICAAKLDASDLDALAGVLHELATNGTRVIVAAASFPDGIAQGLLSAGEVCLPGMIWTCLETQQFAAVQLRASSVIQGVCDLINRIGCDKLVWIDPAGGLKTSNGRPLSFVNLDELRALLSHPHSLGDTRGPELLRAVEMLMATGVGSINLCAAREVDAELFSYLGAGTLFTKLGYTTVRPLQLADYAAAKRLINAGVLGGQLGPQRLGQIELLLSCGFGAFVGTRHLAGMVALIREAASPTAELACLTTVTRFVGQGVAQPLVGFTLRHARHLGLETVFACTTSDRAAKFFERAGFSPTASEDLGAARWVGYDPVRRAQLRCLRCDL